MKNAHFNSATKTVMLWLLLATTSQLQANDNTYGETAHYEGAISKQANASFFSKLAGKRIATLSIDSGGGEVEAGIELGTWVYRNNIDVVVAGACLSSCANYVFTAGRNKRITKGSVVAWHGNYHHLEQTGLWRDDVALRMQYDRVDEATAVRKVRAQVERIVALEKRFFKIIGVDEYLCWVGKVEPYNIPNYYFLSKKDMQHFGLKNVFVPEFYPQTNTAGLASDYDIDIRYLDLDR